jgi:hypothetical protein
VDNQTVIMEFDNGMRADFRLQMFQARGRRSLTVWGEHGMAELDSARTPNLQVTAADGDVTQYDFARREGGHGGTDPLMISRFIDAIERGDSGDSGLDAGIAASVVALRADESRLSGQVVDVPADDYAGR